MPVTRLMHFADQDISVFMEYNVTGFFPSEDDDGLPALAEIREPVALEIVTGPRARANLILKSQDRVFQSEIRLLPNRTIRTNLAGTDRTKAAISVSVEVR